MRLQVVGGLLSKGFFGISMEPHMVCLYDMFPSLFFELLLMMIRLAVLMKNHLPLPMKFLGSTLVN